MYGSSSVILAVAVPLCIRPPSALLSSTVKVSRASSQLSCVRSTVKVLNCSPAAKARVSLLDVKSGPKSVALATP